MTVYETHPSPDERTWQHVAVGHAASAPPSHLTDSALDLERMASGIQGMPAINCWQEDSGWVVTATLWTGDEILTDEQRSTLDGSLAEAIASTRL